MYTYNKKDVSLSTAVMEPPEVVDTRKERMKKKLGSLFKKKGPALNVTINTKKEGEEFDNGECSDGDRTLDSLDKLLDTGVDKMREGKEEWVKVN